MGDQGLEQRFVGFVVQVHFIRELDDFIVQFLGNLFIAGRTESIQLLFETNVVEGVVLVFGDEFLTDARLLVGLVVLGPRGGDHERAILVIQNVDDFGVGLGGLGGNFGLLVFFEVLDLLFLQLDLLFVLVDFLGFFLQIFLQLFEFLLKLVVLFIQGGETLAQYIDFFLFFIILFLRNFIFHFLNDVLALFVISKENFDHFLLVLLLCIFIGLEPFIRFLVIAFVVKLRLRLEQLVETFIFIHFHKIIIITLLVGLLFFAALVRVRLIIIHILEIRFFFRVL